jgi:hypothetical protein
MVPEMIITAIFGTKSNIVLYRETPDYMDAACLKDKKKKNQYV